MLIWLAKAGRLDLLRDQYQRILIPPEVYTEVVVDGLREGYPDAYVVKDAVEQGWIVVEANEAGGRRGGSQTICARFTRAKPRLWFSR